MKQNRKHFIKWALLLVMALLLCVVLTGCYIPTDEVTDDGGSYENNNLPFQTLAPTATIAVTPDTVVINTQNLYGNTSEPSAQTTPAPDTGWEDLGTDEPPVQQTGIATVTVTPAPVSVVTAAPKSTATIKVVTKAPATPTVTPPSLQKGFTGSSEVRALQKRLKELGYYTGSVDGDFGSATEAAVKAFQAANGLTADGKAGTQTLAKLNSSSAITKKQASATATPKATAKATAKKTAKPTTKPTAKPTATPNLSKDYYLTTGSSGQKVKTLQNRLIALGWLGGEATGEYDAATRKAVMAFQKKTSGLYDDGVAGPDTLKAIYSDSAAKSSAVVASTGTTLERGSEGSSVRALQKRLKELGYLSGTVDGSYGVATEAAVIAFQQNNGLTVDGKAGNTTLNTIYADDAIKSGGGSASTEDVGGGDTSGISSTGYITLENGSEGESVKTLQKRLKELGYYNGTVDGKFGDSTEAAVMAYQLKNNLTVDGKAGPATQRSLYGTGSSISYSALREGDEGTAVKNLQYTLYELGYYDGAIDGKYGSNTVDAVRAFQIQNSLTPVDGVAGSNTLAKMYSSSAISATADTGSYETLRPGDKGEDVAEMQEVLIKKGYLSTKTGVYDDATKAAVLAFQKANGLTADGVAGAKTLTLLYAD